MRVLEWFRRRLCRGFFCGSVQKECIIQSRRFPLYRNSNPTQPLLFIPFLSITPFSFVPFALASLTAAIHIINSNREACEVLPPSLRLKINRAGHAD